MIAQNDAGCRCEACNRAFKATSLIAVDVMAALRRLSSDQCPYCGSEDVSHSMRLTLREDRAIRRGTTLDERISDWVNNGEVDDTAKAALDFMTIGETPSIAPRSHEEYRRLFLFLDRLPEFIPLIERLARVKGWENTGHMWRSYRAKHAHLFDEAEFEKAA